MVLNRQAFTELLGPLREVLDRNLGARVIQSVPLLKSLPPKEADRILALFESLSFSAGQSLLAVGQTYSTFFIVKSGTVRITKGSDAGMLLLKCRCRQVCSINSMLFFVCSVLQRRWCLAATLANNLWRPMLFLTALWLLLTPLSASCSTVGASNARSAHFP